MINSGILYLYQTADLERAMMGLGSLDDPEIFTVVQEANLELPPELINSFCLRRPVLSGSDELTPSKQISVTLPHSHKPLRSLLFPSEPKISASRLQYPIKVIEFTSLQLSPRPNIFPHTELKPITSSLTLSSHTTLQGCMRRDQEVDAEEEISPQH